MSTSKHIDKICVAAVVLAVMIMIVFANGEALGLEVASRSMGYEERLFDTSTVHTIDIVMDDWDGFIETCENEEYVMCAVVIDGEAYRNVGIRAKGNTSLSTVSRMGSQRYSFKIEFDQYDNTKSYYGLDKLSLNNLIQDSTFMKDYLAYRLMGSFGVDAPLCSYVYITVNGQDWGLYLAVEGVEEGFLQRNYGSNYGELYKPDSMSFGGGRGNGRGFDMEDFMNADGETGGGRTARDITLPEMPEDGVQSGRGAFMRPRGFGENSGFPGMNGGMPEGFDSDSMFGGGMRGGMGSSDVKLKYTDDDPASYSNIFDNAKTDITETDKTRLIASLKALSEGTELEQVVDIDEVIRYFVVHNFVCNGDSYTGSMVHNYYLYEEDGQMSMIPWDYNLAFGGFQSTSATDTVNTPIDTPVTAMGFMTSMTKDDRPMLDWIFNSEDYTALYHQYFAEFLEATDFDAMIDSAAELIAPYIEKDPTKFYTYEEFQVGVEILKEFCLLRAESVAGQLDGSIPSTTEGQKADSSSLIDASHINLSDMGSMFGGFAGRMQEGMGTMPGETEGFTGQRPEGFTGQRPEGMGGFPGQMPEGMEGFPGQMPEGMESFAGQMPGGMKGTGGTNSFFQPFPGDTGTPDGNPE